MAIVVTEYISQAVPRGSKLKFAVIDNNFISRANGLGYEVIELTHGAIANKVYVVKLPTEVIICSTDKLELVDGVNLFMRKDIKQLDINSLDTSQVVNMQGMFKECKSLEELDISKFNTAEVKNMSNMFYNCNKLKQLNLSSFNTEQVIDMNNMFAWCKSLKDLDISSFNTEKVKNMKEMFSTCHSLEEIDLSNFNTEQVENMSGMFSNCIRLKSIDFSNFRTEQVTDMTHMFANCISLEEIDLSNFTIKGNTNINSMFYLCDNLRKIHVNTDIEDSIIEELENTYASNEQRSGEYIVGGKLQIHLPEYKFIVDRVISNGNNKSTIEISKASRWEI